MTVISDVSRVLGGSNNLFCQKTGGIHLWQMRAVKIHSPNDYQRSVSEYINNITNRKTNIDGNKVEWLRMLWIRVEKNPSSIHTRVDYLCSHACKHKYIPFHNVMQVVCMHVLT